MTTPTKPPRGPSQPPANRPVSTPATDSAANQSRTEAHASQSGRLADLERENELLRHANGLLEEGIATLSAGYLVGQLKELRREIELLKRRERERDTKVNRLDDSLLKARQAFAQLQKTAEKESKT